MSEGTQIEQGETIIKHGTDDPEVLDRRFAADLNPPDISEGTGIQGRTSQIRDEIQKVGTSTFVDVEPHPRVSETVRVPLIKNSNRLLILLSKPIEQVRTYMDLVRLRPYHSPVEETRLGIQELDFRLEDYYKKLNELMGSANLQSQQVGEVEYKGKKYSMYNISRVFDSSFPTMSVVTAIHGNEQAPLLASLQLLRELADNSSAFAGVNINVITPANPIGADYNSRYNGQGYDINRDFVRFHTPEARIIRDTLNLTKPDIVITNHEAARPKTFVGGLMISDSIKDAVLSELRRQNITLGRSGFLGIPLEEEGYLQFGKAFKTANALGSLFDTATLEWYVSRNHIPSITIETSCLSSDQEMRVNGQLAVISGIVSSIGKI